VKKIPATRLTEFLVEEGIIVEEEAIGSFGKVTTEKGNALGIKSIEKVSEKGNAYKLLKYPVQVQKMIVEHYISTHTL